MKALLVALAACGGARPAQPAKALTAAEWAQRCGDRVEVARLAVARVDRAFADATVKIEPRAFHPFVRFTLQTGELLYEGYVERGEDPCIDIDAGDPAYRDQPWEQNGRADKIYRTRRLDGNEAIITASPAAPATTASVFERELERALEACLVEARGVTLEDPPADLSCAVTERQRASPGHHELQN